FGSTLLHWTDRLPLALDALDFRRRGVPVGGAGQRFDARDERFFLGEVGGPDHLALREVGVPPREEAIACRTEALPDRLLLAAADRSERLPLGLELLDLFGRLNPVRRIGERLCTLAQRDLPGQIVGTNLHLRGEIRLAFGPDFVVRRLEAP